VIKIKGINVSPGEIEALLETHPDVDQAFVFAIGRADSEEEIAATLVPRPNLSPDVDLEASVRSWARGRISSYKVPRHFRVMSMDELPLTPTGKVSKQLMKKDFHPAQRA
jgi:fatty-acyl-CoA synthase